MSTSTADRPGQSHEFKAEIKQLLDILIHSVYTSKDIFLRELISNATDALEKVRFLQASGAGIHSADLPLEIRLETSSDGEHKVLTIADTGIGMTADEVHENIGTIAHSGAATFLQQLAAEKQDDGAQQLSLIGRFGVGFYSVFMVAERVVLTTRSATPDSKPVVWTSDGLGSYSIRTLDEERPRGTRIEIHLKKDEARFGEEYELKSAITRYSNFVPFPVLVNGTRVNQTSALWREPASQVKPEQYNEFFKLISHDAEDPLLRMHFGADAPLQYSALLFVPASNPESMGFGRGEVSLHLYVKRVLIDSQNKTLLPEYLRFVRGVVESDDLPLNVSRETLQENRLVFKIREALTRRVLDDLLDLAKTNADEYAKFWRTFGRIVKEGCNDYAHRAKFEELLRFNSSRNDTADGFISLGEYVEAMPAGQPAIYYLSGASREALERDPRLELFRKKKIEVLYLYEVADEFVLGSLDKFRDKPLVSADQVNPDDLKNLGQADAAEEPKPEVPERDIAPLLVRCKEILGDRVIDVRASDRLVDSPACLVTDDQHRSGHIDKIMRMMQKNTDLPKRVLELNPHHKLVQNLARLAQANASDPFIERACEQLFEGSMLVDGYLADPHRLVERMNAILADAAAAKG
ncbi:MAG TPA: molecular chaperone HtpG [Pirellulales bacterium]|nr:molecular chaperone HtpG [Pirellulales bacterium]